MKREFTVCDMCGAEVDDKQQGHWEYKTSHFKLTFPRDGINGGVWSMDVCHCCRHKLYDAIDGTIKATREKVHKGVPVTENSLMPFMHNNGFSTVRNMVVAVMRKCGADDTDWRLRDDCIWAANPWLVADREALRKEASE